MLPPWALGAILYCWAVYFRAKTGAWPWAITETMGELRPKWSDDLSIGTPRGRVEITPVLSDGFRHFVFRPSNRTSTWESKLVRLK